MKTTLVLFITLLLLLSSCNSTKRAIVLEPENDFNCEAIKLAVEKFVEERELSLARDPNTKSIDISVNNTRCIDDDRMTGIIRIDIMFYDSGQCYHGIIHVGFTSYFEGFTPKLDENMVQIVTLEMCK